MSRYTALWPLKTAIVAALAADADVAAALGVTATGPAIYSAKAPPNAPMPRAELTTTTGGRFDTFTDDGAAPTVQIDVYAAGAGSDVIDPVAAVVAGALDGVALALPAPAGGWPGGVAIVATLTTCEIVLVTLDPDGLTMHAVLLYTCTLCPES